VEGKTEDNYDKELMKFCAPRIVSRICSPDVSSLYDAPVRYKDWPRKLWLGVEKPVTHEASFLLFSTCAAILARQAVLPYLIKDGFVADI